MSDVKIVKLVSGQEILGKVVSQTANHIVVQSPLTVQPMRGQGGADSVTLGLLPFSWGGVSNSVELGMEHVLCVLEAEANLSTQYLADLAGLSVPPRTPQITL